MGRTSVAFAPSNPSVAYALAASNVAGPGGRFTQGLHAFFRSDDGGQTWHAQLRNTSSDRLSTLLLTNPITDAIAGCSGFGGKDDNMGWYTNTVAVDPHDENRVWAAGVDLFRSDNGGHSFRPASFWWTTDDSSFAHADQHFIVFDPHYDGIGNQRMFTTNDGGVALTDNARATVSDDVCLPSRSAVVFRSLSHNYGATQFYHGQPFPGGLTVIAGAQDNGTLTGGAPATDAWKRNFGGDGGYVAIDPIDPSIVYVESQFAHIQRLSPTEATDLTLPGDALFITPFLLDPNDRTRLWSGARSVARHASNGWTIASTQLDGQVSALAVTPGNSSVMLAGTNAGTIYRTNAATTATALTAWTPSKPRDGFVSSITIASNVIYATYAGFGGAHVWRSLDGGAAWEPLDGEGDGALPDIPVHALAFDAAHIYIGTDLGIFISKDFGAHWFPEASFPRVITESIALANGPHGPALFAFTHGRGAWRVDLTPVPRRHAVR